MREKVSEGGLAGGTALISDEIVDDLAVAGTPERVRERIAEYREAGVQCPVLFAVGPDLDATLEAPLGA